MSCERGCTGTPICSALDLCCIQFRQDCGKECDGLANGYSTIQIDVNGNFVLCSNVGGVCTCAGIPVGTDTFANVGNGTMRHTALDGTIVDINVCDLITADNCFFEASELTAQGTTIISVSPGTVPIVETLIQPASQIVINNTSDSNMVCHVTVEGTQVNFRNTSANTTTIDMATEYSLSGLGGPWFRQAGQAMGAYMAPFGQQGHWGELTSSNLARSALIAPGDSLDFAYRRFASNPDGLFIGDYSVDSVAIAATCVAVP